MSTRWAFAVITLVMLALAGCDGADSAVPAATPGSTAPADATPTQPVAIRFSMQAGDAPITCAQGAAALGLSQNGVQFNDLRFYVSNVALVDSAGAVVPMRLEQDGMWQSGVTALLDFEDGTAGCVDAGNTEMNTVISGTVAEGDYTGIQFDLGIPAPDNHQDVTVAPSPLNLPALWWSWQGGYKFVRIDMKIDMKTEGQAGAPTGGAWFVHLGSTGCASANEAAAPTTACLRPNLATIRLNGFDPAQNTIVADMASFLAQVDLSQSTPMPPGCMAGADDPDCIALFPAFGLDIATGACVEAGCPTQTLFRVE